MTTHRQECEGSGADPLPANWYEDLRTRVDLERAFALLRPIRHFYAEAWKGRLRTLQLRFDSAWKHFDKAYKLTEEAEETIPNLVRQFVLNIWCFENALQEAPLSDGAETEIEEAWIPELPEETLEEYPEVRVVIRLRRQSEALLRLHLGHFNDAAEIYRELIEAKDKAEQTAGDEAIHHLGLAAAEQRLGFPDRAVRSIETAGLCIAASGQAIDRLHVGAFLVAFHRHLKQNEEAESWKAFLEHLECPETTRSTYLRRADHILERMETAGGLVIL
jgi:tetratricopeptide (TPR) repeat protein